MEKHKLLILKDNDDNEAVSYISVPADMMLADARIKRWLRIAEVHVDETPPVFHVETLGQLMEVMKREFPTHFRNETEPKARPPIDDPEARLMRTKHMSTLLRALQRCMSDVLLHSADAIDKALEERFADAHALLTEAVYVVGSMQRNLGGAVELMDEQLRASKGVSK